MDIWESKRNLVGATVERINAVGRPTVDPYIPGSGNPGYRVSRYELDLTYRVAPNNLDGTASVTMTADTALQSLTLDFSPHLRAKKVSVSPGKVSKFTHSRGKLTIRFDSEFPAGAAFTVSVRYSGNPKPIRGLWGEVGWEELDDGVLVGNQPNGAASWFPCDDVPAAKATYGIRFTADSPYQVICTGDLTDTNRRSSLTTRTFELAHPTSTYLVAVNIGQYEHTTLPGSDIPVHAFHPAGLRSEVRTAFAEQGAMMRVFCDLFGPYPFEDYRVVVTEDDLEIPLEAMGMSTFGANMCTTDTEDERLIAHELAHQWFGNAVTAREWQHIWLHEGFACYAEWLWSEASGGPDAADHAGRHHSRLAELPEDILLADPGPEDMFDDRIYKRGALALHSLRQVVGDDPFFELLRDWVRHFSGDSVTTDDFITHAAQYTDLDLRPLWRAWLFSEQLPATFGMPDAHH